jgi:hypothetical protein
MTWGLVKIEATNVRNKRYFGKPFSWLYLAICLALANLKGLPKLNGEIYFLV